MYRLGVSNGAVTAGKLDGVSQQTGLGIRAPIHRNDQDNSSLVNDKRVRPVSSDKERVNFRAVNKYAYFLIHMILHFEEIDLALATFSCVLLSYILLPFPRALEPCDQ